MNWWGVNHCGQSRLVRRDSTRGTEAPSKQAKGTLTEKAANALPSPPKKSSEASQGVGRLEPIYFNIKRQHDFRKLKELVERQGRTSVWLKPKFLCFFHWNNPCRVAEYAIQKYAIFGILIIWKTIEKLQIQEKLSILALLLFLKGKT